jgi:hypothetical protein
MKGQCFSPRNWPGHETFPEFRLPEDDDRPRLTNWPNHGLVDNPNTRKIDPPFTAGTTDCLVGNPTPSSSMVDILGHCKSKLCNFFKVLLSNLKRLFRI